MGRMCRKMEGSAQYRFHELEEHDSNIRLLNIHSHSRCTLQGHKASSKDIKKRAGKGNLPATGSKNVKYQSHLHIHP